MQGGSGRASPLRKGGACAEVLPVYLSVSFRYLCTYMRIGKALAVRRNEGGHIHAVKEALAQVPVEV